VVDSLLMDRYFCKQTSSFSLDNRDVPGRNEVRFKRISCGVPQGSVILPLLFLIYINDITKASSLHTTLFADDINLHMSNSCFNVLQTTANLELCEIDYWLRVNKLSLNYNKTNFMLLTFRKHNSASFKVIINNHNISLKIT